MSIAFELFYTIRIFKSTYINLRKSCDSLFTLFVCLFVCLFVSHPLHLVRFGQLLGLRYADKLIVKIMKVYIKKNNLQVELI